MSSFAMPSSSNVRMGGGSWGPAGSASGFANLPRVSLPWNTSQDNMRQIVKNVNPNTNMQFLTNMASGPCGSLDIIFNQTDKVTPASMSTIATAASLLSLSQVNAILVGRMPKADGKYYDVDSKIKSSDIAKTFSFMGVGLNIGNISSQKEADNLKMAMFNLVIKGKAFMFNYWAWFPWYDMVKAHPFLKDVLVPPSKLAFGCDMYLVLRKVRIEDTITSPFEDQRSFRNELLSHVSSEKRQTKVWQFLPVAVYGGQTVPSCLYTDELEDWDPKKPEQRWTGFALYVGTFDNTRSMFDFYTEDVEQLDYVAMHRYTSPVTDTREGNKGALVNWADEAITDPVRSVINRASSYRQGGLPQIEIHVNMARPLKSSQ